MAAFDPAGILLPHHVTIDAGFRIVGEIGAAARVHERIDPDADEHANGEGRRP